MTFVEPLVLLPLVRSSFDLTARLEATEATKCWSWERVAIIVRAEARRWDVRRGMEDIVSVGWQWAS
jgi:hypothetical protein